MNHEDCDTCRNDDNRNSSAEPPKALKPITYQVENTCNSGRPEGESADPNKTKQSYLKQLWREKPDRHIELLLTFAITFFALVQLISSCRNNDSTAQQTEQLISAAKISAYAAQQNLQAARDFSTSARNINEGISEAVNRLGIQAYESRISADTAGKAVGQAKKQFAEDRRPYVWVADGNAIRVMAPTSKDPAHLEERITFKNFGTSPAIIEKVDYGMDIGNNSVTNLIYGPWQPLPTVYPPSKDDFISFSSKELFSAEELTSMSKSTDEKWITTMFRIRYRGQDRHLYETDMCFTRKGLAGEYCPASLPHNRMIDCEKEECKD